MTYGMIEKAEKGSRKHLMLLKIEEGLNVLSERANKYIREAKTAALGLGNKHAKMIMEGGS